jgi:putative IMPACT (imprinted ancient) family translation regulator
MQRIIVLVTENGQEYYKPDDDGEPSGTAGKPIGEIFINLDVYNLVVVVTRYFGGIKLGAGGLIRNYAKTSKLAVIEAGVEEYIEKKFYILDFSYSKSGEMDRLIYEENIQIEEKSFEERISYKVFLTKEQKEKIENLKDILIIKI